MYPKTNRPAVLRDSWRPEEQDHTLGRRIRKVSALLLFSVLFVAGMGAFFYLLTEPILHPNTFLVLATGDASDEISPPPVHFSQRDLEQFESLSPALSKDSLDLMAENLMLLPGKESSLLQERLNEHDLRSKDILIVYIAAHGMVINGEPYLLSDGIDQTSPQVGSLAARSLLELVSASNAKIKLIVLDSGQLPFDPWIGNGANQFVSKLQSLVWKLKLENLWVLTSNDVCQLSTVSERDQSSVFSFYVREGLRGHADLDSDGVIRLREFYAYVRNMVVEFSSIEPNVPIQVPVLIGQKNTDQNPVLISVKIGKEDLKEAGEDLVDGSESDPTEADESEVSDSDSTDQPSTVDSPQSDKGGETSGGKSSGGPDANEASKEGNESGKDSELALESGGVTKSASKLELPSKPDLRSPAIVSTQQQQALDRVWSRTYSSGQELIGKVWELYFSAEQQLSYPRRPLDYAPVEWRKIGEAIVRYDYMLRRNVNEEFAVDRLREIKTALEAIIGETQLPNSGKLDSAIKVKQRSQSDTIEIDSLFSLTHIEQLHEHGFCKIPIELRTNIELFSAALNSADPAKLIELLAKKPQLRNWYEPWLASQLLRTGGVTWAQLQEAITLTRMAGSSSNPIAVSYVDIAATFEKADKYRRIALRLMLEQTDPGWSSLANDFLKEARRDYESALIEKQIVQNGLELRNEILFRLPYYVKLSLPDSQRLEGEVYHRLCRLMDAAQKLRDQLANRAQVGVAGKVTRFSEELVRQHREFRLLLESSPTGPRAESSDDKTLLDIQAALLTPAFGKTSRSQMLLALRNKPRLNAIPAKNLKFNTTSKLEPQDQLNEFLVYQRQFDLVLRLARLFKPTSEANSPLLSKFQQLFDSTFEEKGKNDRKVLDREAIDNLNLLASDTLRDFPKRLNRELQGLQDFSDYDQFQNRFDLLDESLVQRLLFDSRDSAIADLIAESAQVWRTANCFLILDRQRLQIRQDLAFGSQVGNAEISKKLEFMRLAANELPNQPKLPRNKPKELEINCVDNLGLTNEKYRYLDVEIRFRGNDTRSIWLIAEYDRERVSLVAEVQNPIVDCNTLSDLNCSTLEPFELVQAVASRKTMDDKTLPATVVLRPGETKRIRLRVESKNQAAQSNLLLTASNGQDFARHKVVIRTPDKSDWELYFTSTFSETIQNDSELVVSPIPNSRLEYFLALKNRSGAPRKIQVEFQVPQRTVERLPPIGAVSSSQLTTYFESIGFPAPLLSLADIEISASDGLQAIPLQEEKPKGAEDEGKEKEKEETKDLIRHGLFVTVTDQTSLMSQIWLIRFRPQMPRHYVEVQARYNSVLERIIIDVRRKGLSAIPENGHVIKCEFANPLVKGTESYLEGQLTKEKPNLRLFAQVPRSNDRIEKVFVHVDGYPRAFVFNVPCGRKSEVVEESRNEMRVKINSPQPYQGFKAPVDSIPVEFEVDAPVGAFSDARDRLSLGLDADRDRELFDEPKLSWTSDRQVTVWVKDFGQHPRIKIENLVDDFKVDLPGAGYRNLKVNLLASLRIGQRTVWSEPNEIWLDSSPPDINVIQTPSVPVAQSEKLVVRILADDKQMSGVKSIKVGFSDELPPKLSEELPTADAKKQEDSSWIAELPLSDIPPGIQTIAVSAEDAVGNKSPLKTAKVRVISEAQKEKMAETFIVKGQVKFNKVPQAKLVVEMLAANGTTISVKTEDDGTFQFKDVAAGQYVIKSRKVVKNNPRLAKFTLVLRKGVKPDPVILELE